jgi:hypothetical protein
MPSSFENEWTFIEPTTNTTMASTNNTISTSAIEPTIEVTINTKPTTMSENEGEEATERAPTATVPKVVRHHSIDSNISDEIDYSPRRTRRRSISRRDFIPTSPSPSRRRRRTPILLSSTDLLSPSLRLRWRRGSTPPFLQQHLHNHISLHFQRRFEMVLALRACCRR